MWVAPLAPSALPSLCPLGSRYLPIDKLLKFDQQQHEQIDPKTAHKMPVRRSCVQRALAQYCVIETINHSYQSAGPAGDMQRVHRGKYIKERAIWIRG